MQVLPVNNIYTNNKHLYKKGVFFRGKNKEDNCTYNKKQKVFVATTSTLGVITSLAIMAKHQGYSILKPKIFKDFKNSFIAKADFDNWKPIVSMGAGSILGGLAGGFIIDKNKQNRKSKAREALLQMGNVSIPILVVDKAVVNGICKNSKPVVKAIAGLAGLFAGVGLANIIMNKINNLIFNNKNEERGVKLSDFSAHVDDLLAASECIFKNNIVHALGRIIPIALTIPGYETGKKQAE